MTPEIALFVIMMGAMAALLGNLWLPEERATRRRRRR
jgi:uncharacterized membrane protein YhhN